MSAESKYTTLVSNARGLCGSLVTVCHDSHNLDSIGRKSRGIMHTALSGLLHEMQERGAKVITGIKASSGAMSDLRALTECLMDVQAFFEDLAGLTFVM